MNDKDLSSIRKIQSLAPFVPDLKNDIDNMKALYDDRTQAFYDHIYREDSKKMVSDSVYEDIKRKSEELINVLHVLKFDISNKISHEIDKLEKGIN